MVDPLPDLILKDELSKEEIFKCKQVIFGICNLESKNENLPLPNLGGGRGGKSGFRRDEQYKLLFTELEKFLRAHSGTSSGHSEILGCVLDVRNKNDKDKVELDQALRELDRYVNKKKKKNFKFIN